MRFLIVFLLLASSLSSYAQEEVKKLSKLEEVSLKAKAYGNYIKDDNSDEFMILEGLATSFYGIASLISSQINASDKAVLKEQIEAKGKPVKEKLAFELAEAELEDLENEKNLKQNEKFKDVKTNVDKVKANYESNLIEEEYKPRIELAKEKVLDAKKNLAKVDANYILKNRSIAPHLKKEFAAYDKVASRKFSKFAFLAFVGLGYDFYRRLTSPENEAREVLEQRLNQINEMEIVDDSAREAGKENSDSTQVEKVLINKKSNQK